MLRSTSFINSDAMYAWERSSSGTAKTSPPGTTQDRPLELPSQGTHSGNHSKYWSLNTVPAALGA
eukprot:6366017-Pyramimonas_sp.AAC.1